MVVALVIPTCRRTKINRRTMAPVGVVDRQLRLVIDGYRIGFQGVEVGKIRKCSRPLNCLNQIYCSLLMNVMKLFNEVKSLDLLYSVIYSVSRQAATQQHEAVISLDQLQ